MVFFNMPHTPGGGVGTSSPPALSGSGAPSDTIGSDGQIYVDVANRYLYGPKTAGSWGSGIQLTGADWADIANKPTTFAPATHSHSVSDVTGLQTQLDGKASTTHSHAIADVTGLQSALDGKQASGSYATLSSGTVPASQLPVATTSTAGVVTIGSGLSISSGVLSATGGSSVSLSSSTPSSLGTASAGSSTTASRSDHVHAMPSASDISTGTLAAARLPLATTSTAGAVIVGSGLSVSSGTISVTTVAPTLSDSTPQPLGTATAGTASLASRSDHVHAVPSASDIVSGTLAAARLPLATTTTAGAVIVGSGLSISSGVLTGTKGDTGPQGPAGSFADPQTVTAKTSSYTLQAADVGSLITLNGSSGAIVVTVPLASSVSWVVGSHIDLARIGAATVEVAGITGVSILATPGTNLREVGSAATLVYLGSNSWLLVGDLA